MEKYFDEEIDEAAYYDDEGVTDEELNFRSKELLKIVDRDYCLDDWGEEDEYDIDEITVPDLETFQQIIEKAERDNWEALRLVIGDFEEIPAEIGRLINLKLLSINVENSYGKNIVLPPEIGKLKRLEAFDAYGCNMVGLPEEFGQLTNLKRVNLNHNNFTVFPKEILSLKKLKSLAIDLSFKILPDEICDLVHLRFLYLPKADISYLPENIGALKELEVLCIWGTKVNRLPDSCRELKKIKSLYLTKSIFEKIIPPEIISQSPLEVIDYILRYQSDTEKIEVNESKMIIVGQGGVGKTCLLNRLKNDKYDETASTEGIAIEPWEFETGGKKYKLNIWDFGGAGDIPRYPPVLFDESFPLYFCVGCKAGGGIRPDRLLAAYDRIFCLQQPDHHRCQ